VELVDDLVIVVGSEKLCTPYHVPRFRNYVPIYDFCLFQATTFYMYNWVKRVFSWDKAIIYIIVGLSGNCWQDQLDLTCQRDINQSKAIVAFCESPLRSHCWKNCLAFLSYHATMLKAVQVLNRNLCVRDHRTVAPKHWTEKKRSQASERRHQMLWNHGRRHRPALPNDSITQ